ncbi:MAG: hypothetical protein ACYYKD_09335 [Rhodospirillales bacterium]
MSAPFKMYACFFVCILFHVSLAVVMFWIYMLFPESLGGGSAAQFKVLLVYAGSIAFCWFAANYWMKAHPEHIPDIMKSVIFVQAKWWGLSRANDEEALKAVYKKVRKAIRRNYSFIKFITLIGAPFSAWATLNNADALLDAYSVTMHFAFNCAAAFAACYLVTLKYISDQDEWAWERAWKQIIKDHKRGGAA